MKINIYYGGRGLIDDPTLYVIGKMQEVLEELHVTVERYHLCEMKNAITTLPQTLKEADGVILASTVEWYGIGGFMTQFLDACFLYGDKEKISETYMCPVVMSTTYGEREGKLTLSVAWEILGGLPCSGLCGYIADTVSLEMNTGYTMIIEKKAENLYRTINQKMESFPASNQAVKKMVSFTKNTDLTPQESEQLSQYASDDTYVQKQKEDIQELTNYFKDKIGNQDMDDKTLFVRDFEEHFQPQPGFKATYRITIQERKTPLILQVNLTELKCYYGKIEQADVSLEIAQATLSDIIAARMTFQRAFMGGDMKMKGDFKVLRTLDQLFIFTGDR
ncbi:MAG: SCP2 sterol-binding domain-containing protein [Lachnospiraceae bacterium]